MTAVLLYDGECGFCTACAHAVRTWIPSDTFVLPYQRAPLESLGVSQKDAAESVQWVDETSQAAGPDALAALMRSSKVRAWRAAGRTLSVPPIRAVAWPTYRLVSRYRGRLPGVTPTCSRPALPVRAGDAAAPAPETAPPAHARRLRPRPRRDGDIGGCVRLLYNYAGTDPATTSALPADPRAWLSPTGLLGAWVVQRDAHYIGHVAASAMDGDRLDALRWAELVGSRIDDLGLVSRLLVRPAHADGVAARLLDQAAQAVRGRGLVPVSVVPAYDEAGLDAYTSAGWHLVGVYPLADREGSAYYYRAAG